MREGVAITGANGAVGQAILRLALRSKTRITALVRSERAAATLPQLDAAQGRIVRVEYDRPRSLALAFQEAETLIHLPGILVERRDARYEEANVETTRVALEAALEAGIQKLVLVSALGADPNARNRYFRTKGEAEALLQSGSLDYTILRAPLVLGPGTQGWQALHAKARGGFAFMLGGGGTIQQPLDVDDLARAALLAAEKRDLARNSALDLAGPDRLQEHEIVRRIAELCGRRVRILPVPILPVRWLLWLRTRLLGPGLSPEALEVITTDTCVESELAAEALGLRLTPLESTLRRSLAAEAQA